MKLSREAIEHVIDRAQSQRVYLPVTGGEIYCTYTAIKRVYYGQHPPHYISFEESVELVRNYHLDLKMKELLT